VGGEDPAVNDYLTARYGAPCRECGYAWSTPVDAAAAIVVGTPDRLEAMLAGRGGDERAPGLAWDVTSYVAHLADNNRIWAERIAGAALGAQTPVQPYDEAELATARGYGGFALSAALWSLRRSVLDWTAAWELQGEGEVSLTHPEQGPMAAGQVVVVLGHESQHHVADVETILAS
jgi:hypothetical protein